MDDRDAERPSAGAGATGADGTGETDWVCESGGTAAASSRGPDAAVGDPLSAAADPTLRATERTLKELVGGPLVRSMNGAREGEIYLARSWLVRVHGHVRRRQGDTRHADRVGRDRRRLLVAVANRLGLDVEALLAADPLEEVRTLYGALRACERTGYDGQLPDRD